MQITKLKEEMGKKLRSAREERGYSQEEMAKRLGLTKGGYGSFERGRNLMGIEYLIQLPHILDKPLTYFLPEAVSQEEIKGLSLDPLYQDISRLWRDLDPTGREFVRTAARVMHDRISALRGLQPQPRLAETTVPYQPRSSLDNQIAQLIRQIPKLAPLFDDARRLLPEHAVQVLVYNVQIWIEHERSGKAFANLHRRLGELLEAEQRE